MSNRWDAWLRRVESVGFRSQYQRALDENVDSLEQLEQLYVRPAGEGKLLDPKFFADFGIREKEHQRLFAERLCGPSPPAPPLPRTEAPQTPAIGSPVPRAAPPAVEGSVDRRLDPDDGKAYTLQELTQKYVGDFSAAEVQEYWDTDCVPEKPPAWAPAARVPLAAAGPCRFVGKPCSDWLAEVGVEQARYLRVLEDNFDSVEQVEEAYATGPGGAPDLAAFYADVGVANADRRRFEEWFLRRHAERGRTGASAVSSAAAAAPAGAPAAGPAQRSPAPSGSGAAFSSWLRAADPRGELDRYLKDLEDNYDGPDQVKELYLISAGGGKSSQDGKRTLDPLFFEDMGIQDERHRQLFRRFLGEAPGPEPVGQAHREVLGQAAKAAEAAAPATQSKAAGPAAPTTSPFACWLQKVDPTGSLSCYLQGLEENYDGVEQIEELYVVRGGGGRKISPQFFEDMGVEDRAHQALFIRFYGADPSGAGGEPSASAATPAGLPKAPVPEAQAPESRSPFARWLLAVDPDGRLLAYLKEIQDNYDAVGQVEDLYVYSEGSGRKLDPQFFDDMGISDKDHQALFLQFYGAAPVPAAAAAAAPTQRAAAAEMPRTPERVAPAAVAAPSPFTRWLKAVDPSGGLLCYLGVIEDNYDGVDQIEELYASAEGGKKGFDPQFFADMGIEDQAHQALFVKYYCGEPACAPGAPCELKGPAEKSKGPEDGRPIAAHRSPFESWLSVVDPSGSLLQYRQTIEDNYDSVQQIEELYVNTDGGGRRLGPQFFEDVGIEDASHRALLINFYCELPPPPQAAAVASAGPTATPPSADVPSTAVPAPGPAPQPAPVAAGSSAFTRWLLAVDPAGGLLRYQPEIEDNYDAVDQIEELYVTAEGAKKTFDTQFFEDVGIADEEHKGLFTTFYCGGSAAEPGGRPGGVASPSRPKPTEEVAQVIEAGTTAAARASPFARWLLNVESSGVLLRYQQLIEDNYDDVGQIEELYVSTAAAGRRVLAPQFFEDLGVTDAAHQALFASFYRGGPAPAPTRTPGPAAPAGGPGAAEEVAGEAAPAAAGSSPFARWLLAVDSSGGLLRYRREIEDNYDEVGQIEDLYVTREGGRRRFDPQFFDDMGIKDVAHQALFTEFYCRSQSAAPAPTDEGRAPSEEHKAAENGAPAPASASPLGRWLLIVDSSGSLLRYQRDIEDNYDGVDQIEDLYVSTEGGRRRFDPQFFEDMGIRDTAHQALFAKFYGSESNEASAQPPASGTPPADLKAAGEATPKEAAAPTNGSPFARWLLTIDASGALLGYEQEIKDNYDDLGQIEDLYVTSEGGSRKFDPQFFEDMGIEDAAHQALFAKFYCGHAAATPAEPLERAPPQGVPNTTEQGAAAAAAGSSFKRWLMEVDPSGGLLCFQKELEDNYDEVDQVEDLYAKQREGGGKSLDPQFFEDMGIEDPKHRELFEAWFARTRAASHPAAAAAVPPASEPSTTVSCQISTAAWLREMDPQGSLDCFRELFEENFDDVEQIRDLYIIERGGMKVFDPQMFEDVGIKDKGQQALVEAWFAKVVKALPPVASAGPARQPEKAKHQPVSKSGAPSEDGQGGGQSSEDWYQKWLRKNNAGPRRRADQDARDDGTVLRRPRLSDREQHEWYQKWLRRQENRPALPTDEWKEDASPIDEAQERWSSDDKTWYTFPSLKEKYRSDYSAEELEQFWRKQCKPRWVVEQEEHFRKWEEAEKAKPKEDQEWYQKWLRRQEVRTDSARPGWLEPEDGEINEQELRLDPQDGEWKTFQQTQEKYGGQSDPKELEEYWRRDMRPEWKLREEEEKRKLEEAERAKPKEEQEWYQKWLRRQEFKENRPNFTERWKSKGGAQAEEGFEGRKIEPECGKAFTFEELKAEYGRDFSEEDLRSYWQKEMTRAEG